MPGEDRFERLTLARAGELFEAVLFRITNRQRLFGVVVRAERIGTPGDSQ